MTVCQHMVFPDIDDPPGTPVETCSNPATYTDCEGPTCEEHRCRRHAPKPLPGATLPPAEVEQWRRAVPAWLSAVTA